MKKALLVFLSSFFVCTSCTPLTSSVDEKKHQEELTLHEIQTNVDDLRHDINRYQTEQSISDDKIRYQEKSLSSLKEVELKELKKLLESALSLGEKNGKRILELEKESLRSQQTIQSFSDKSQNLSSALVQYKKRLNELETELIAQNQRFSDLANLEIELKNLLSKTRKAPMQDPYRVKAGDSLEKIAQIHHTTVEKIRELNALSNDVIEVGQELKIP